VPMRDDHTARGQLTHSALELVSDVPESGVHENAAHEVRAHVVSHRLAAPRPHADPLHVVEARDFDHAAVTYAGRSHKTRRRRQTIRSRRSTRRRVVADSRLPSRRLAWVWTVVVAESTMQQHLAGARLSSRALPFFCLWWFR